MNSEERGMKERDRERQWQGEKKNNEKAKKNEKKKQEKGILVFKLFQITVHAN